MLSLDEVEGFAFRTGRVDCSSSDAPETTDEHEFPEPTMTGDEIFAYYAQTDGPGFGFSSAEVYLQTCGMVFLLKTKKE